MARADLVAQYRLDIQHAAEELSLDPDKSTTKTFMELIREGHSTMISSFAHGTRSNSATEFKELIQRVADQTPESFTAALASRHEYEIAEIKSELQRLNKVLTLTAYFAGGILWASRGAQHCPRTLVYGVWCEAFDVWCVVCGVRREA